jgi:hypothetical protein
VTKAGESDALFGTRWIHVFEEDTAEGEVYRPETEDVPLSRRPRRRLELSPDGTARILVPGPDDRLVESPGTWEAEGGQLLIRAGRGSSRGQPIRVREHSPTRLIVAK